MVKVYQHRFIKTMMISLTLILLVVLTLVNILNFYQLYQKVNHKADYLIQHDGKLPYFNGTKKEIRNDTMFETRFFTVKYENGEISEVNTSHIASISRSEAEEYASCAGWMRYRARFTLSEEEAGKIRALSLGEVGMTARVRVNEKELG